MVEERTSLTIDYSHPFCIGKQHKNGQKEILDTYDSRSNFLKVYSAWLEMQYRGEMEIEILPFELKDGIAVKILDDILIDADKIARARINSIDWVH